MHGDAYLRSARLSMDFDRLIDKSSTTVVISKHGLDHLSDILRSNLVQIKDIEDAV